MKILPSFASALVDDLTSVTKAQRDLFFLLRWSLGFWLRLRVAPILAYAVAILSGLHAIVLVLESADKAIHVRPRVDVESLRRMDEYFHALGKWLNLSAGTVLFGSLFTITLIGFMWHHHHRLMVRIRRYSALLSSIRDMVVEGTDLAISGVDGDTSNAFMARALQAVVFGLEQEHPAGARLNATIVTREHPGSTFGLYLQHPKDSYELKSGLSEQCAASRALRPVANPHTFPDVVYIPHTKHIHGISLSADETTTPRYSRFTLVRGAFIDTEYKHGEAPKALLCTEVPIASHDGPRYVLCVGSDKTKSFGQSVLAMVFSKSSKAVKA